MVEFNEDALQRAIAPGIAKLEAEYSAKQRVILTELALTHAGRPASEVYDEIVRRSRAEMPGWEPDEKKIRAFAEQIEDRKA